MQNMGGDYAESPTGRKHFKVDYTRMLIHTAHEGQRNEGVLCSLFAVEEFLILDHQKEIRSHGFWFLII